MANELPNEVPNIPIPDLKKKEKEKKKAGAAWGSGGNAGAFEGATGGVGQGVGRAAASAARAALMSAGEGAAEMGVSEGAGFFGRFLATTMGKVVAAIVAALAIGAAGMIAAALFGANKAAKNGPDLGGIASNMRVHGDGDASGLDMARGAGRGDLKFEDGAKNGAPAKADEAKPADPNGDGKGAGDNKDGTPGDGNANGNGDNNGSENKDTLAHNLSGAKLSDGLGSKFGGGNVFGGSNKIGQGFSRSPLGFGKSTANRGKAGSLQKIAGHGDRSLNLGRRGIRNSRALGSLRAMAPMGSGMRNATTTEEASSAGLGQFEGSTPGVGTQAPAGPPGGTVTPPTPTGLDGTPQTPPTPNPSPDNTPWKDLVKQAHDTADTATNWILAASIICTALFALALIWLATGCCAWVAAIIFAILAIFAAIALAVIHMYGDQLHQLAQSIKGMGGTSQQGGKSEAEDISKMIDQISTDVNSLGYMDLIVAGAGGYGVYAKVSADNDALQKLGDSLDKNGQGAGSGDQTGVEGGHADGTGAHDPAHPTVDGGGGGCFIAGTPVATPDGARAIETIQAGETIYAIDPETYQLVPRRVVKAHIHVDLPVFRLALSDGRVLMTTEEHPFFDPLTRTYRSAGELKAGDRVVHLAAAEETALMPAAAGMMAGLPLAATTAYPTRAAAKRELTVVSAEPAGTRATVFNVTVEGRDLSNYLADGVLVHNVKNAK